MLSSIHWIPERYGQMDGRTDRRADRFAISISRVSMLGRDKNLHQIGVTNDLSSTVNTDLDLEMTIIILRHHCL